MSISKLFNSAMSYLAKAGNFLWSVITSPVTAACAVGAWIASAFASKEEEAEEVATDVETPEAVEAPLETVESKEKEVPVVEEKASEDATQEPTALPEGVVALTAVTTEETNK